MSDSHPVRWLANHTTRKMTRLGATLVGLLLVLAGHAVAVSNDPQVARIAYFNYPWESDGVSFADDGYSQLQEAMAPLAVALFNDRRADILPVLGTLGSCNKNLSIPYTCATGGNQRIAFNHVLELMGLSNFPNIIVGPVTTKEAQSMAMASAAGAIPVISHWATSDRLANRALFPTFMRTIASDAAGAIYGAALVKHFKYTRCGLLYENSDFGSAYKDALFTETARLDITMKFQAFGTGDQLTTSRAMRAMAQSKLQVIFVVCYLNDLSTLGNAFVSEGLADSDVLFIFLALDSTDSTVTRVDGDDNIAKLLHGSLYFVPTVASNPRWENFKQKVASNEFLPYEPAVNLMFQPNGAANRDWKDSFADASQPFAMPAGLLGGTTRAGFAFDVWTYTFDAVITAGLALCEVAPTADLPASLNETFQQELYDAMISTQFDGLSGRVGFDPETGDRLTQGLRYDLINFKRTNTGVVGYSNVGLYNHETAKWDIDVAAIQFRSGVGAGFIPSETVQPVQEMNYLPKGLKVLGYVEVAIMNIFCIYALIWLKLNEGDKVVINAQGTLLSVLVLGCLVASWSVLALTADDQDDDALNENASCMVAPVLFSLGFQLALLAMLGKLYRIYVVFKNASKLKKSRISTHQVLAVVAIIMTVEMCILIVWIVVAPLRFERLVGARDEFGSPLSSFGQCSGGPASVSFVAIVFGLHAAALVATGFASSYVKDLPAEFQESRYLNYAILSMCQIFVLAVPTTVATYTSVIGRFVIMSTVVFVTVLCLLGFLIFPKITKFSLFGSSEAAHRTDEELNRLGKHKTLDSPPTGDHRSLHLSPGRSGQSTNRDLSATKVALATTSRVDLETTSRLDVTN